MKKKRKFYDYVYLEDINGETVLATHDGKLELLDQNLQSKRVFEAGPGGQISDCLSISGNEKFIAAGYFDGTVRYWSKSGGKEPMVR